MGHGGAVLAFPPASPVEAVPVVKSPLMDLEGDASAAPLLESPLSLGCGGSSASEACLGVSIIGNEVHALPVVRGPLLNGEVYGAIRALSFG